jgi:predicted nucleic acid-binding protein
MKIDDKVLVDTSIWADHIDRSDSTLQILLDHDLVLIHPYVIGELAMGNLKQRDTVLRELKKLHGAVIAKDDEVLRFIVVHKLSGTGIGYIDAHLLASTQLTPETKLWTRDRRLREAAERLALDFKP